MAVERELRGLRWVLSAEEEGKRKRACAIRNVGLE